LRDIGKEAETMTGAWSQKGERVLSLKLAVVLFWTAATPPQYQAMLGKGLDVDWSKTDRARATYDPRAVEAFKVAGLSHVRIRIKDPPSPALLAALDEQVRDCLAHGLIPVVAYKADAFKRDPSAANLEAVVAWWKAVAEHLRAADPRVSFDLVIEPGIELNHRPDRLNALYEAVVTAIRLSNPQRILFIAPALRSSPQHLAELKIPSHANGHLMAEWHFYASGPARTGRKQWTTGTPLERRLVLDIIAAGLHWQKATGIPTWVGAWMPGDYNEGNDYNVTEQANFARFVSSSLDAAHIPFAVNSDSEFYDYSRHGWITNMQPVLAAILHPGSITAVPSPGR
jgi:hypothetical protein